VATPPPRKTCTRLAPDLAADGVHYGPGASRGSREGPVVGGVGCPSQPLSTLSKLSQSQSCGRQHGGAVVSGGVRLPMWTFGSYWDALLGGVVSVIDQVASDTIGLNQS
jgi:hypothetical protein